LTKKAILVERGTHQELMSLNGVYSKLIETK
jgi:ABC-type multidrug transport system fused ATPase/permease subunit